MMFIGAITHTVGVVAENQRMPSKNATPRVAFLCPDERCDHLKVTTFK
jgi:hypothetical protein